ncbi:unnamed protein product [Hymenolepis diminuta]|uniref:Uncharacterized protein n=1 Tax=Hymenolepis diminuta TaxID=6216 RepID=A0A564Z4M1_HYMDI|nr:unnamed protein product [Hymenolepis diminuta]
MEYSMPKVIPERLVRELPVPKQQIGSKSYLSDHLTNQLCRLEGHKENCDALASPKILNSFTKIEFPKCLDQL